MTNIFNVCLLAALCCFGATHSKQLQGECSKGPSYWCENLRNAAECNAVAHCISTVWEKQTPVVAADEVSARFLRLLRALKDIRDFVTEEYLSHKLEDACESEPYSAVQRICRAHTLHAEAPLREVLRSQAAPEAICVALGMCNNEQVQDILKLAKLKDAEAKLGTKEPLLGAEKCTWGPSYWCTDLSTAHECKAAHHCVTKVWSKMEVPVDNDSVCQICKDMVKQARDQLQSNETQEELKEVFEGSCKLIMIKPVTRMCMKLADDFVPELVETLASEMNPDSVCSVAGLCNSRHIDHLLDKYNAGLEARQNCKGCHTVVDLMRTKFDNTPYETFLTSALQMCRKMDSFSDSCSTLVFTRFEDIYAGIKQHFDKSLVCDLSRQCIYKYHQHPDQFTYPELKDIALPAKDDLPCELCEQLVKHLRDMVVANTTEIEFERVLKGICKQTGNFKTECLSLVDQWYPVIYNYLVSDLKPQEVCALLAVCPSRLGEEPIAPLLPKELIISSKLIGTDEENSYKEARVPLGGGQTNVRVVGTEAPAAPAAPALPLERMFVQLPQDKTVCAFCQYFLHYLQVEISDQKNEDEIKKTVEHACERLPETVSGQCRQFVDQYGPAVIALMVQEIDPSSVCPALGLCPQTREVQRVTVNSEGSSCPLCLFAVEQLETMLKDNRTEANIKKALDGLCNHLSQKLKTQCMDFVDTYSDSLVEMLIADMNAQEICTYLKLCTDTVPDPLKLAQAGQSQQMAGPQSQQMADTIAKYHDRPMLRGDRNNFRKPLLPAYMLESNPPAGGDVETNEIPDNTHNGKPIKTKKSLCVICEFVMKEIDAEIKDKHNADEIKSVVHGVCNHMPRSVRAECNQFVDKYADLVIALLAQELEPSLVCEQMKLCPQAQLAAAAAADDIRQFKEGILECAVCETAVAAVQKVLSNPKIDRDVVHVAEKSCGLLPAKYYDRCHRLMEVYGDSIIHLVEDIGAKGVCGKIGICDSKGLAYVELKRRH